MRLLRVGMLLLAFFFTLFSLNSLLAIEDKVVAIVNNDVITENDVKEYKNIMHLQLSSMFEGEELKEEMKKVDEDVVERLVEDKLILQEARKKDIKVNDTVIEARIQLLKSRFVSDEEYEMYMKMRGLTPADLKRKITEQIQMHDIIDLEVRSKIFVHPQEVTNYYEEHKSEIVNTESLDLDSIFIRIDGNEEKAEEKAQEILAELKKGKDFAELKEKYSDAPALGQVKRGQLNEQVEKIVFALNEGEVSVPVKMNTGIYIFKVKKKNNSRPLTIEEARDQIYEFLFNQKFQERFMEWTDGLKKDAYILIK